jgi:hypothetical protein
VPIHDAAKDFKRSGIGTTKGDETRTCPYRWPPDTSEDSPQSRRYSAGRGVLGVGRVALGHWRYAGGFGGLVTAGVKMSMIDGDVGNGWQNADGATIVQNCLNESEILRWVSR